jgi:hypothetical protein
MMKAVKLTAAAILALMVPAAALAQTSPTRPAATTPTRPAAATPAPAAVTISNVPQVCQIREREIVSINGTLSQRNAAANRETDQARKNAILTSMEGTRAALRETEASWDRMDCGQILYVSRRP